MMHLLFNQQYKNIHFVFFPRPLALQMKILPNPCVFCILHALIRQMLCLPKATNPLNLVCIYTKLLITAITAAQCLDLSYNLTDYHSRRAVAKLGNTHGYM